MTDLGLNKAKRLSFYSAVLFEIEDELGRDI